MFTKQHHTAIAKIIAAHVGNERYVDNEDTLDLLTDIVKDFCDLFEKDNSGFSGSKFVEACANRK